VEQQRINTLAKGNPSTGYDSLSLTDPTASQTLAAQDLLLGYFTPTRKMLATAIEFFTGTVAFAGATLNQVGLYRINADGTGTLVAKSDPAALGGAASANAALSKAFVALDGLPASVTLLPGKRYAAAHLVDGITAGSLAGKVGNAFLLARTPRHAGKIAATASLPTTLSASPASLAYMPYFRVVG